MVKNCIININLFSLSGCPLAKSKKLLSSTKISNPQSSSLDNCESPNIDESKEKVISDSEQSQINTKFCKFLIFI